MATEEETIQMKHMLREIYNRLDSIYSPLEDSPWVDAATEILSFLESTKTEKGFIWET